MNVNGTRSFLYSVARFLGDYQQSGAAGSASGSTTRRSAGRSCEGCGGGEGREGSVRRACVLLRPVYEAPARRARHGDVSQAADSVFQAVGRKANPRPREMKLNPPVRAETVAGVNTPNAKDTTAAT
jgi:hypothetical protein